MRVSLTVSLAIVVLTVSGCSSMSKNECLSADWHMIGTEDGSLGRPLTTLANHRKACAKVNITPNQQAYEAGHHQGLLRYCTYDNGYKLGNSGGAYRAFCPGTQATKFSAGFEDGHNVYLARKDVQQTQQEINRLQNALEETAAEIALLEESLVKGEGDEAYRRETLDTLEALQHDIPHMEKDLFKLRRILGKKQRYYDSLVN